MRWPWRLCGGLRGWHSWSLGFRYSLLPFDDSLASVEILHDVSEEQNSCVFLTVISQ